MPLPAESERAASEIQTALDRFDRKLLDHIEAGDRLPTVAATMGVIVFQVRRSVIAALRETDTAITSSVVDQAVREITDPIRAELRNQIRNARAARRRVPRRPPDVEDDETAAAIIKRVGAGAAFLALLERARRRRTRQTVRDIARIANVRTPKPTAAWARMVVRTRTAISRNEWAAAVAERDRKVLLIRDALKGDTDEECERVDGLYATPMWTRRHPVEHPNCVAPGQYVTGGAEVLAAWSRPFDGQLVTIVTAGGNELTVTPNHPVLTTDGFQPASRIHPGSEVVAYSGSQRLRVGIPNDVDTPPLIEQIADALVESGSVKAGRVPAAPEQFHGDGTANGDVDVVWSDRFLTYDLPELLEVSGQPDFVGGHCGGLFSGDRAPVQFVGGASHSAHGVVSGSGDSCATVLTDSLHVESFGVGPGAGEAPSPQPAADRCPAMGEVGGDHVGRFPAGIPVDDLSVDRVVSVKVSSGQGFQVHDLTTSRGWYSCSGIIVSNCTRMAVPVRLPAGARITLLA